MFATIECKLTDGYSKAEGRLGLHASRQVGRGQAVYVNLSTQRYLQYREEKTASDQAREPFLKHVLAGDAKPWLKIVDAEGRRPEKLEATYWSKGDRTLAFVLANFDVTGSALGGGGAEGLIRDEAKLAVEFPADVEDIVDERSGRQLGAGRRFEFEFKSPEAIFFSFRGRPPRAS